MKTKDIADRPSMKGSKGPKSPRTTPDNLFATDAVEVLFGISEGPIKGLVNGANSFYIGDTPLAAADGSNNFEQFELIVREGGEQGEDITSRMGGFGSSTTVNTNLATGIPVVRSGTYTGIDYVDIRMVISALGSSDSKGNTNQATGRIKIEYKRSDESTWRTINTPEISPPPPSFSFTGGWIFQSLFGIKPAATPAVYDKKAYAGSVAPAGYEFWFDTNTVNLTPKQYVNGSWSEIAGAAYSNETWTWPGHKATIATALPIFSVKGDFWVHPTTHRVHVFNGDTWVISGSTYTPGAVGANGTGGGVSFTNGEIGITGKTSTSFVKEFRIPLDRSETHTYDFRITKTSPESSTYYKFEIAWESFQEVTGDTFNFPGLATAQLTARASEQFSSLPEMSGEWFGRVVRVPSNYDPVARTYTGVWDGTWKFDWTDNPALIGYDLVVNTRYGLSAYYPITLNKWDVYEAAQWCDVRAADGKPRFSFNGVLNDPKNGREMINYIFGTFGGRFFDDGNGTGVIRVDRDTPAVAIFTKENVAGGLFTYSQTALATRHNDITVTFVNPDLNWQEDRRRVADQDNINVYGRNATNMIAVGCIDPTEAIRRGRYKLATGLTEKTLVSFTTNRAAQYLQPYDVILVADIDHEFGYHGRVKAVQGTRQVVLRDPIHLETGVAYQISFNVIDNIEGEYTVLTLDVNSNTTGTVSVIETVSDLSGDIQPDTVFSVHQKNTSFAPKPFRVTEISPSDDGEVFKISAVEVNRLKWAFVDGVIDEIESAGFYELGSKVVPAPVPAIAVRSETTTSGNRAVKSLIIDWEPSPTPAVVKYRLSVSANGGMTTILSEVPALRFEWRDITPANYVFQIEAIGPNGIVGRAAFAEHRMLQEDGFLPDLPGLLATNTGSFSVEGDFKPQISVRWEAVTFQPVTEYQVRWKQLLDTDWQTASVTSTTFIIDNPQVDLGYEIEVRAVADAAEVTNFTRATLIATGDTVAPPIPTNWLGMPGFDTITLEGDLSPAVDFRAFRIYGYAPANETPTLLAELNATSYTRRPETPVQFTRYRVSAVDKSGNESGLTPYIEVLPLASLAPTPPAIPTGFNLTSSLQSDGKAKLVASWTANAENTNSYEVRIKEGAGNDVFVGTSGTRLEWVTLPGVQYTASVRAISPAQIPSSFSSNVVHTTLADTVAPSQVTGLTATPGFGTIWLKWTASAATDLARYEIYEYTAATPAPTSGTAATYVTTSTTFARSGLGDAVTRHYWVRAVDTSGNKSGWSTPVETTTTASAGVTTEALSGLIDATSFASGVKPVEVVSTLPDAPHVVGRVVVLTTDGKLYRNTGMGWTAEVKANDVDARGLNILDVGGNVVFGADGTVSTNASIKVNGNNVLLSTVAANSLVPSLNYVGSFSSAPNEAQLGTNWKQNAVYKNTTDGKSYVLTGDPLGWIEYLSDGQQFTLHIESSNGTAFKVGQGRSTLLSARVFKNGAEVTEATPASWFKWRRVSIIPQQPPHDDATFNANYASGYKAVSIDIDQVNARATFFCDLISS